MTSQMTQIAARRRSSGAFLIGSLITLASSFGFMTAPVQAQDPGFVPVAGAWTRGGNDSVAWLDLATWKLVTAAEGSRFMSDPQPNPWLPVVGDFDGDGVDSIQMFNPADWRLVPAERGPQEGRVGDPIPWLPVAGDWDGDRIDTVKVVNACNGTLHDLADGPSIMGYCDPDDWWFAVAGEWEGRGIDTLALYQEQAAPQKSAAVWATLFGDWDGDGIDTEATLHMPTGELVQGAEEQVFARSLVSQASSVDSGSPGNVFDAAALGGPGCFTTIKNKQTTWVKKYTSSGIPLYVCYSTWEEWTCCFGSSINDTVCSMRKKSGYTC
jgi:hypothetical protein